MDSNVYSLVVTVAKEKRAIMLTAGVHMAVMQVFMEKCVGQVSL